MNERIFELADQAAEGMAGLNIPDEFCEKFAELIVRECARVASDRVMDVEGNDWGVRWAIKNHFGVEQ
jgi:hypothetical protein